MKAQEEITVEDLLREVKHLLVPLTQEEVEPFIASGERIVLFRSKDFERVVYLWDNLLKYCGEVSKGE
jgi:hypothetical protein